jgi:hypothetical protein
VVVPAAGSYHDLVEVSHDNPVMFAKGGRVYFSSAMMSELKQLFVTDWFRAIAFDFLIAHERAHIHFR